MNIRNIPSKTIYLASILSSATIASNVLADEIKPDIKLNGLIEASLNNKEGLKVESIINTLEIGFEATLTDDLSLELVLLQENINSDEDTYIYVDEATASYQANGVSYSVGKFTVPFSIGETNLISDPQTLVEPSGVGFMVQGNLKNVEYSFYAQKPDEVETYKLTYTSFGDILGVNLGLPIDAFSSLNASLAVIEDKTAYSGAYQNQIDRLTMIVEGTRVMHESHNRIHLEAAYDIDYALIVVSIQKDIEDNYLQVLGMNKEVYKNTELKFEYINQDTTDSASLMLGIEF